jgi:iron complex outermembrane receptor protein
MTARFVTSASLLALMTAAPALAERATETALETGAETGAVTTDDVITVISLPIQVTSDEVVGSVTAISQAELKRLFNGNIADTLDSLPGVHSSYFGPASGRPIIRGLGEDRVRVLINGVGGLDASTSSPDHAVAGEVLGAQQVDVLRGPAAIAYGGGAIGGVVNILDGRIPTEAPEDTFDGFAYLGATSVDDGTQAAGRVSFGAGPLVFQLDGLRREADNFDIPGFAESAAYRAAEEDDHDHHDDDHDDHHADHEHEEEEDFGTVSNSFYTFETVGGAVSLVQDWGYVGFGIKQTDGEYGLPGHSHEHGHEEDEHGDDHDDHDHEDHEHGEEEDASLVMEQTRIDLRGEINLGEGLFFDRLRFSFAHADYIHAELEGDEIGTAFDKEGLEGRIELTHAHNDVRQGAWGLQLLTQDFQADGEEAFIEPVTTQDWGLFAVERWDYGRWGFEGGARIETRKLNGLRAERRFDTVSASGSIFARPSDQLFLSGTISRTERAPTDTEVFAFGPHVATESFEIGDLDLDKETALSFEGTARWRADAWRGEVNVFHADYDGFIGLFPTGAEEDELDVFEYRQTDATLTGFEVSGSVELGEAFGAAWSADGALDYVQGETDSDGDLPRIPPVSSLIGLEADFGAWNARGEVRLVGEQSNVAANELATDGYTLFNASAQWQPVADRDVSIIFGVRNITDEEARAHTSFLKDLVPLPGRNYRIALVAGF